MEKQEILKHFATATYILHPSERKVLLLFHKKLKSWLPPGGHLDENETPDEGAAREVLEETGLEIDFFPQNHSKQLNERVALLPMPHHMQFEKIEENHFHIDFVFFARAKNAQIDNREQHEMSWFGEEELEGIPEAEIFGEAREWAKLALAEIR